MLGSDDQHGLGFVRAAVAGASEAQEVRRASCEEPRFDVAR